MAYVINQPAPPPVIIEQPPPPVIVQSAPPPVIIEQSPPPVIVQPAPPPVIIEQSPPPVIVQPAPSAAIIQAQPAVAVIQPPGPVVMQAPMKSVPASTRCGFCQQQIVTMTRPINGLLTWVVAGTLLFLFIWPFCVIPFFVKSCKDIEHTCPNCKNVIYIHKRM
ncbi:uncharacterized protein LOC113537443 [Pangasianodon hypophthalmus]|uniref:uncharacterized protein LOC113537443 n=1 Tax=Pangasianodon hypophthalmus TaxID=310915 RepID=UPI000EFEDFA7|nr:uncharacterized protein LOC113537443 [Pangasianodon hypophthalmus]